MKKPLNTNNQKKSILQTNNLRAEIPLQFFYKKKAPIIRKKKKSFLFD